MLIRGLFELGYTFGIPEAVMGLTYAQIVFRLILKH